MNKCRDFSKGEYIKILNKFKEKQLAEKEKKFEYDYFEEMRNQYRRHIRKYSYNNMIYNFKKKQDLRQIQNKGKKNFLFQAYADKFIYENCHLFIERNILE